MQLTTMNLFTIAADETSLDRIMEKYVKEGFLESYRLGEPVFILKNGTKVNKAKKKDIDWEAMDKEAMVKAQAEATTWGKLDDEVFIETRFMVHKRPTAFIDKSGKWRDEDEDGLESQINEDADYQYEWEKALKEISAEDVLAHFEYQI